MHDDALPGLSPPHCHQQRVEHEFSGQRRLHRPTDDLARVQVHDDGEVEPSLPGPNIGDVGDPDAIGRLDGFAINAIRCQNRRPTGDVARYFIAAYGSNLVATHEPRHPMPAAGFSGLAQVAKHAWRTINAAAGGV